MDKFSVVSAGAVVWLSLALAAGSAAQASASEVILTIEARGGGAATTTELSFSDLEALPQAEVRSVTPWTEGVVIFSGPDFGRLAEAFGPEARSATLVALNDYRVTVDVAVIAESSGVLATRRDGAPMSVRENGPLWLTFPSADRPELAHAEWVHNWIWQVERIIFHSDASGD